MCLDENVSRAFSCLYMDGGTYGNLERYHKELTENFKNDNSNLFVKKFKEEYEKLNYPSMSQLEKDIINGLIFAEADGTQYISFDKPIESAYIRTYEAEDGLQKPQIIALQSNFKYYEDSYLMISRWNHEYSNGSISVYHKAYYHRRTPSGDVFIPADVSEINRIIQDNKDFLDFMAEYISIKTDADLEEYREEERIKEEKKSRQPEIGMTKDEVLEGAWGSPQRKNITENASGTHEQWVYSNGRYIYFDNDIVTSIQRTE